ncbi:MULTISPECIES: DUF177 domain-containing protein [unclassified Saccharibacter]|uniref:DUF177 domain-containing protein n=1 Tax=unclassified Saccharibacter TaxID=2648722 RepID=UPI001322EAF9|nr:MULTISPECIES: DUF177 domain-containing protein [unclassified Saccharibacter]MXV35457.1 DUF177 domain-containing protein [Saccharibacter sp. EH611]MXV58117.1 DUF177 domain-containing protein [Saccharibacter sp. EH70]MXV65391.1 DUF177 domain-containing protein [Saccharibacter sp. EH60]
MTPKDSSSFSSEQHSSIVKPEFSHRIPLGKIGHDLRVNISAPSQAREKLCHRFGLLGLEQLDGQFSLSRGEGKHIRAEGEIRAKATQACVITGEPVDEEVQERFSLRFLPQEEMPSDEDIDIEALLAEEADDVPYDGRAVDLGEALAEQLALCLDPYPRREGSGLESFVEVTPEEGEEEVIAKEEKPNPFSVLEKLKEKKR